MNDNWKSVLSILHGKNKIFHIETWQKNSWFVCHRCFLSPDHEFRRLKNAFRKNRREHDGPPLRLSGHDVWKIVQDLPKATRNDCTGLMDMAFRITGLSKVYTGS